MSITEEHEYESEQDDCDDPKWDEARSIYTECKEAHNPYPGEIIMKDPRPIVSGATFEADLQRISVEETTKDRQKRYGPPREHFQRTVTMLNALGFRRLQDDKMPAQLQVDDWPVIMIIDKLSRAHHDRDFEDNFHDIAGYVRTWEMLRGG